MSKYIFLTGLYLPKPGATGLCVHQLAKEAAKRGYDVTTICYADGDEKRVIDGVNIVKINAPSFLQENMTASSLDKKINHFKSIGSKLIHIRQYPLRSNVLVRRYCEAIRNLLGGVEEVVTIVASVNPLEAVIAADRVKQENSAKVKTVYYCADTLSNEKGDSGILSAEYRTKCGIAWERKLFKSFDKVLIMECHKDHYFSSIFKDLSEKMELVNFPLFTRMEADPVTSTEDGIIMVYAGTLYKELRNPSFLCDQLVMLSKIEPIHVIFMGSGDCDDILMNASSKTKGAIQYLGMQSHAKAMEFINSAHVLLSIGNAESPMAPSKIYEYMSTGKPIIHTYTYEKDPCLEPLRRYGNALLLRDGEPSAVGEMSEFIRKAKYLDYPVIEKMFIASTPGYSMDIIEKS